MLSDTGEQEIVVFDYINGRSYKSTWEAEQRKIMAERNRYRMALEAIAEYSNQPGAVAPISVMEGIAKQALAGGTDGAF